MITKAISVCCAKDIRTWQVAATRLPEFVAAQIYEVIVPDHEVAEFRARTPSRITVTPESTYLGERNLKWVQSRMPEPLHPRAGWYLQQFIKIEVARLAGPGLTCVIWDADTIPLRPLEFEDAQGRLLFYRGNYRPPIHQPYFDLIRRVLGLERLREDSYIAQCFALRTDWVKTMCAEIEARFSVSSWIDAVLANVDHSKGGCGFSEYETLGTYFEHRHPDEIRMTDRQYLRHGTQLIGAPEDLTRPEWQHLNQLVDFVAFEVYETGRYRGLHIGCGNTRVETTFNGNRVLNTDIRSHPEIDLLLDVARPMPFPDGFFEHVIACNILGHVDDMLAVIDEIDRCLQVGGIIQIEVSFFGSYNHGTDVTHKRGLTFDSFNFLLADNRNYLFRDASRRPYDYRLAAFFRENFVDGQLVRENLSTVPARGSYGDWLDKVLRFEIPGTFGMVWQKVSNPRKAP